MGSRIKGVLFDTRQKEGMRGQEAVVRGPGLRDFSRTFHRQLGLPGMHEKEVPWAGVDLPKHV